MTGTIYVIAEMAYSHDGSVDLAERIVRDAASAGADAISIHITHMPDYMVRDYGTGAGRVSAGKETSPIYDYLCDISLSFDQWERVAAVAREVGLDLVIMPNDGPSLDFAVTLSPDALVVPPACFEEHDFIDAVGRQGTPIYLRVGGATLGEIESVIERLRATGAGAITLLYGHQNYPTSIADTSLRFLECLRNSFGLPVGIADHVDADDDFALMAPLLAIPLGITCIEKHITHDRAKRGEDFESALNGDELARLVTLVRKAEMALGVPHAAGLDASSRKYRGNVRKRLVAARAIAAGETITADALIAKRSDAGVSPAHKALFVGSTARTGIAADQGMAFDLIVGAAP
ncbi:N-acetylneuraminate synthase family protein [Skermanella stibiiresistens]|nr:N-acetylneuraminate synthase family protein [Skermanella stibiiresistens]